MKIKISSGVAIMITVLVAGLGGGYWLATQGGGRPADDASQANVEKEPLFYRNPMNPEVTSQTPTKDNMGMDYIPVYDDEAASSGPAGTVSIDPVNVQNIGVRTATAEFRNLSNRVIALGRVGYDEDRLARLHPKIEGWIEETQVSETGQAVEKGTILVGIYSPVLVTTQQEYLLAIQNLAALQDSSSAEIRKGAEDLVEITRGRLALLDVPEHQIAELEETGKLKKVLHIHSPFDGIILSVGAREGQYVTSKTELYQIADLSSMWVYVDIYEHELPWIQVGDRAEMQVKSLPGRPFTGQIKYIYPYLDEKTRTVKLRLEFDNADLALKSGMFANVTVYPQKQINAVVIPEEAVIRTGAEERVFIASGGGRFEPRDVTLGVAAGGLVQIITGVKPGEQVVTSGQFLIDSESSMREAITKMRDAGEAEAPLGTPQDHNPPENADERQAP